MNSRPRARRALTGRVFEHTEVSADGIVFALVIDGVEDRRVIRLVGVGSRVV